MHLIGLFLDAKYEVCRWNSILDMASFLPFLAKFDHDLWPWPSVGQGHRPLDHWMRLIRLYLGTKYEVCKWNGLQDMTSSLFFYAFLGRFDLDLWPFFGQGHRHLGHWMCLIRLYLGTKYEVCRWNSLRDMTSSLFFYQFLGKFDLDLWPWPFN